MNSSSSKSIDTPPSGAAEKRDFLARLLARLAHEIRNPLSSLDIHVQLLQEDVDHTAPHIRQILSGRLGFIQGELHRLENIVKRFLRLASPTALELEPVNISEIVNHVCKLLEPEAHQHQITLNIRVDAGLPTVIADGGQLTQALINLIINGLQAVSHDGRVDVRVGQFGQSLLLEVMDSGPGVPIDKRAAVFEPYFTTKEEGSGLGLWIAQQIALAHGGSLEVAHTVESGAVFRFCIPIEKDATSNG